MDVRQFQEKLREICEFAKKNGNRLTQKQIREHFAGAKLETEQLVKVLQYLKVQGISIEETEGKEDGIQPGGFRDGEGTSGPGAISEGGQTRDEKSISAQDGTRAALTAEEEEYLKDYLASLGEELSGRERTDELFTALSQGDAMAEAALTRIYLPVAARMAADMNCEEIHLADLIQEANVALLTALSEPEPLRKDDAWLRLALRKGIIRAIEEQTQQKFQDDCLVAKVERLEAAVKELADDDGKTRFTIDELAVILDMGTDEIRDVLRLTGDDK